MRKVHLLCNAHLDPCWLWEWEEGAAEALSTFRTAADLCEEYDGFIFNHNEVVLYKWVEEYEPALFQRIQRLVKEGKWRIMGGWYLQPDCNMPSGESFVRQCLIGKGYFQEKFGVEPTTAINFDPFGHTRGLAQILRKAGYDSYIHCRPGQEDCPLPDADYIWVGYDGSEIAGHRTLGWYGSPQFGKAREKVEEFLKNHGDREVGLVLWGVGNHGGGPSRKDLDELKALMAETPEPAIAHSTAEAFFQDLRAAVPDRPRHTKDINSWAPGCYTSQVRLKQKHRLLENELYVTEKMAANAALQSLMAYPKEELHEALCDLLVAEFHDILPGSSVQAVEDAGVRLMDHALEIISRLKARTFFSLASGQLKAPDGKMPILAYNPHPFKVSGIFECEFNLPDAIWEPQCTIPTVCLDGRPLPCQLEREVSNVQLDWRKRNVFYADLEPSQMNRFDCDLEVQLERPAPTAAPVDGKILFQAGPVQAVVNCETGLLDQYALEGVECVRPGACRPIVIKDNEDPWGMTARHFREIVGEFTLMDPETSMRISGLRGDPIPPVRVIEDGPVRTVVEAMLAYGDSFLILRYGLPKCGTELSLDVRVHWNEKDRMLKLAIPTGFTRYLGQVAYGRDELPGADREVVAQKWTAAAGETHVLTCINDGSYGSDFVDGEIRLTLLRSPAYSGHPIADRPIVPQDRYTSRQEQGERRFRFWLNGGPLDRRLEAIDREALVHNEKPFVISFFPSGAGSVPLPGISLSDDIVQLTAFKQAEGSDDYIFRLFEPTGAPRRTIVRIVAAGVEREVELGAFEIKSFRIDRGRRDLVEVDLLERPL